MKTKTLSDKIYNNKFDDDFIEVEDVKEFIGEILMTLTCIDKPIKRKDLYKMICKRAGDKLI